MVDEGDYVRAACPAVAQRPGRLSRISKPSPATGAERRADDGDGHVEEGESGGRGRRIVRRRKAWRPGEQGCTYSAGMAAHQPASLARTGTRCAPFGYPARVPTPDDDKPLMDALAKAEQGLEPSPFGELVVKFPISPVSLQSPAARKEAQRKLITSALSRFKFMLCGDVQVEVTWRCRAKARYESDASPDVDNILKPLLDALCGPDGVLVDDCQVTSIGASCFTTMGPEEVEVQIKHGPHDFIAKEGLLFLDAGRALCVPITETLPTEGLRTFVEAVENMLNLRAKLEPPVPTPGETASSRNLCCEGGGWT